MKITYTPNPLNTIIELDEHEKEVLKLKIKIRELEESLGSASVLLDPKNASWIMKPSPRHPEGRTIESLIAEVLDSYLNMSYMYSEGEYEGKGLDGRVNELFDYCMDDLTSNHVGDCICVAMSCSKCHTEELLGINTIKGLGKHSAHKIESAFSNGRDADGKWLPEKSIDEVLEILKNYTVVAPTKNLDGWAKLGGWEQYVPRWTAEAKAAYEWLKSYKDAHFN